MNNLNQIRNTGIVCMTAALVWIIAISIEYPFHLQPPGSGALYFIDQLLFFIAIAGYVATIGTLIRARVAGDSWFGRIALGLFGMGWSLLLLGQIQDLILNNHDLFLFPIGGLMASLGCLLSGIAIVAAKRWQGWQRWSVLIYAIYYWAALFLPLVIANQEPNQITETIWGLAWLLIGFALYSYSRNLEMVTA
jgi:hypothetical protein